MIRRGKIPEEFRGWNIKKILLYGIGEKQRQVFKKMPSES